MAKKIVRAYRLNQVTLDRLDKLSKELKITRTSVIQEGVSYLEWILQTRRKWTK